MNYEKPELSLLGSAIARVQADLNKTDIESDGPGSSLSVAAYRADE